MLEVNPRIRIPLTEFEFSFSRSSGPGGQNVNKVNSKATLRWRLMESSSLPLDVRSRFTATFGSRLTAEGELVLTSDRYRDQPRNADDCLEKLREMLLAVAEPPRPRKATKPTKVSKRRRADAKRQRGEVKRNRGRVRD